MSKLPRRLSGEQRDLVTGALWLVKRLARRLSGLHGFDYDECVGVGELALTEAVFHYDPSTGVPFHVFGFLRVRGEILDSLGKAGQRSRLPLPTSSLGPLAGDITERTDALRDSDEHVRKRMHETLSALAASFALSIGAVASEPSAEDSAIEVEHHVRLKRVLDEAIGTLPAIQRELIHGHYDEGLLLKDLVVRLDTPYRTLRRRHQEALVSLASELRARGVHQP